MKAPDQPESVIGCDVQRVGLGELQGRKELRCPKPGDSIPIVPLRIGRWHLADHLAAIGEALCVQSGLDRGNRLNELSVFKAHESAQPLPPGRIERRLVLRCRQPVVHLEGGIAEEVFFRSLECLATRCRHPGNQCGVRMVLKPFLIEADRFSLGFHLPRSRFVRWLSINP